MKIVSYALTDFISTIFGRIQWNEIYDMICVSRYTPLSVRDASVFNFYKLFDINGKSTQNTSLLIYSNHYNTKTLETFMIAISIVDHAL